MRLTRTPCGRAPKAQIFDIRLRVVGEVRGGVRSTAVARPGGQKPTAEEGGDRHGGEPVPQPDRSHGERADALDGAAAAGTMTYQLIA